MRRRLLAALMLPMALTPFGAAAQGAPPAPPSGAPSRGAPQAPPPDGEEEEASETEGQEVVDEPSTGTSLDQGKATAPGEVHTVVRGDTLWDLSQRYLGSPWYWPKVWSYNPEIANPHWIYPGNLVRFFPAGEEVPSRVEVGTAPGEEPAAEEPVDEGVQVTGKIGYTPRAAIRLMTSGFVTPKELDEAGSIHSSFAESDMLSFPDVVYLKFKQRPQVRVGETYVVYKTVTEVSHPSGGKLGFLTHLLGTVKVLSLPPDSDLVRAQILATWDEMRRGDRIGPVGEQLVQMVSPRPNDRDLKGVVVSNLTPFLSTYGEHHYVIIDRGSADGVQQGNTFTVVRRGDPLTRRAMEIHVGDDKSPQEDIGACMAVDVKEKATVCLLTRSIREIVTGDKVEMRTGGAAKVSLR